MITLADSGETIVEKDHKEQENRIPVFFTKNGGGTTGCGEDHLHG
jgi:galactose-1-phosphate uridylyltransferase